ncbi:hypothetical protein A5662_09425 [Mycobacteriaceae bacterium 1482268.1]|nr:hypothetical protein A5662_09425 [Mycobacteriaceae bacterium 1482268.1]
MSSHRTLFTTAAAVASSAALIMGATGPANAEPAAPLPIDATQAPGLSAMEGLSPAIQKAAADPYNAVSTLMAAAAAFSGNSATPTDSKNVASAVNSFVAEPAAAHVPAPGAAAGEAAHLPAGVDPAHAVGPAPEAIPAPAPAPEVAQAVPSPAPAPGGTSTAPEAAANPAFGPDAPTTQDFLYPSISNGCLKDGGNVLATAISVAGPAKIPAPGVGPGQTAYVFTAIGTPGPAAEQKLPLNVTWVNLTTGKSGSATLKPRPDINPEGPTTLSVVADTGSGSIMSTIFGQVTTTEKQCQFMPTIGSTVVP